MSDLEKEGFGEELNDSIGSNLVKDENSQEKGSSKYEATTDDNELYIQNLEKTNKYRSLSKTFAKKELFDRIGYGFASHQFLIIFMFLIGTPTYLVGILNGLKDVLSAFFSSFLKEYSEFKKISNKFISIMGYIFGFSFLVIAFSIKSRSILVYALAFLIGGLGIVTYGELYNRLLQTTIRHEKRSSFLKGLAHNGIVLTAICFLFAGIILDKIGVGEKILEFAVFNFNIAIPYNGYLVIFEIAAFTFIFSGYVLSKLPSLSPTKTHSTKSFFAIYLHKVRTQVNVFFSDKNVRLMILSTVFISIVQSLGNAYYGYYIYHNFRNSFFSGFTNISIIFVFAIFISFFGTAFTNFLKKRIGAAPTFVFGTLLLCIMPLVLMYNLHFSTVMAAAGINVLGGSIIGMSQGLLVRKLLNDEERKLYFQSLSWSSIIPFIVFVPICSFIAHIYGFELLFAVLIFMLILIVLPLNFRIVFLNRNQKL